MTSEFPRARVNAIIASAATLNDVFPQDIAFDMGLEKRAYAVCGRRAPDGTPLEPEIIAVDKHGMMYCVVAPDQPDDPWSVQQHLIPELAGAAIINIAAVEQDPKSLQDPRLLIQIAALDASRRYVLLTIARTKNKFEMLTLPRSPVGPEFSGEIATTGIASVGGGKLPVIYQCYREPQDNGISLNGYAFASNGESVVLGLMDNPTGVDHLIAPAIDWSLGICRVEPTQVKIFSTKIDPRMIDHRNNILPVSFGNEPSKTIKLPIRCDLADASSVLPVSDTTGLCHGVFIISPDNELVSCSFLSTSRADMTAVMTGRLGGPLQAKEVAYSFGDEDALHIFVSDEDSQIWYANWPLGARPSSLIWQPTGQVGTNLRAPQIIADEPKLFVASDESQIEMLMPLPNSDDVWTRTAVVIPSDQQVAVPAVVHAIEIMTVTAQSDPVAGEPVEIFADRDCVAEYGGQLIRLNTRKPFKAETGMGGGVRLRFRVTEIAAPQLRVRLPEREGVPEAVFQPEEGLLRKLSGLDPNFQMNGAQLKAMGMVPDSMKAEEADQVAQTVREASRQSLLQQSHRSEHRLRRTFLRDAPQITPISVSFSVQDDGSIAMDHEPPRDKRLRSMSTTTEESPASFMGWLRAKWASVKKFAIEVVQGAIKVIVETVDKVKRYANLVGHCIEYGINSLFKFLKRKAEAAKDWVIDVVGGYLADKLEWQDILRVKNTMKTYLLTSLDDVRYLITSSVRGKINGELDTARGKIDEIFDQVLSKVENRPLVSQEGLALPHRGQVQQNSVLLNVVSAALPNTSESPRLLDASPETKAAFDDLYERTKNFGENARLRTLLTQLYALFTGQNSFEQVATVMLSSILRIAKEIIKLTLDIADVVANAVLDLVANILSLIREGFEKPLLDMLPGFTYVSSIYRKHSGGKEPSFIDLLLLVFTAPGTLLYNIVKQKNLLPEADIPKTPCTTPLRRVENTIPFSETAVVPLPPGGNIPIDNSWTDTIRTINVWVDVVWACVSIVTNTLQNFQAYICMTGGSSISLWMVISRLVGNFADLISQIIDFATVIIIFEKKENPDDREKNLRSAFVALSLLIVLGTLLSINLDFTRQKPDVVSDQRFKIAMMAVLDTFLGALEIVVSSVQLAGDADSPSSTEVTLSRADAIAGILTGTMLIARLGLPIGAPLSKLPEPTTTTIGFALVALTGLLDAVMPPAAAIVQAVAYSSTSKA